MKIYLVGGAVRDQLLNIPVVDKDYLVVGSTPQEMLDSGFKPIGKDFPVFLHPKTKEEYALARTEKKVGIGHKGFTFYSSPEVTLEQDLERRDITINAIAVDENNNYIDPFNGIDDLKKNIIRHVSSAFEEDPLRVLRVARFKAKLISFTIHKNTYDLMNRIVRSGEINHLSAERLMMELKKGFEQEHAFNMLEVLNDCGAIDYIFPKLEFKKNKDKIKNVLYVSRHLCESSPNKRLLLVLLVANHDDHNINNRIYENIKKISLPSFSQRLIELIEKNISELVRFTSIEDSKQLDLFYRFDFFRRPKILNESLDLLELIIKDNKNYSSHILLARKLIECYKKIMINNQSEIDKALSGEQIKKAVYKERLSLLKKLKQS
jgi:tRNA nucleotidyltransferase (CCA-adding enzyme)